MSNSFSPDLQSDSITAKSYTMSTQGIGTGKFYSAGFYDAPVADANLNQGSLTQTYGAATGSPAAHAFIVAGGAGSVDTGVVGLRVTGTRIQDDGTRTTSYSEVLSADITTLSLNEYLEGAKFLGTMTFELYVVSGAPTAYSLDFNYGFCKYEDFGNQDFTLRGLECVWYAGANDSSFDIELFHHSSSGWTYHASAFAVGGTLIAKLSTIHSTEHELIANKLGAFKRTSLSNTINGSASEGLVLQITTGTNNSIETLDSHLGVII